MKQSHTKYKIQFQTDDEIIKKALELVIKKDQEFKMQKEANNIKRHIVGLFPDVEVVVLSISRYTRVRRLKR